MTDTPPQLAQMRFADPEGRREILWVERVNGASYAVMNVPVFLYGVSVGTIVQGTRGSDAIVDFTRIVRQSRGGTVRVILPRDLTASAWYLDVFLPAAAEEAFGVGPATFFDPRMVAVHVHDRGDVWGDVGGYLTELAEESVIQQWEPADPERDQDVAAVERGLRGEGLAFQAPSSVLTHPEPVPREEFFGID